MSTDVSFYIKKFTNLTNDNWFFQIVLFLLSMCLFASIACGLWEYQIGQHFKIYLPWEPIIPSDPILGSLTIATLVFFSYAIVLNTLVPISLYVR